MHDLADIAESFVEMAHRIVWATAATVSVSLVLVVVGSPRHAALRVGGLFDVR